MQHTIKYWNVKMEILHYNPDGSFNCIISLKVSVIGVEKQIGFSDKTTPRDFNI